MKIYLDKVFFLNFAFDFILLLTVSILLRRNVKIKKIMLGALIGGLSIFVLFIRVNSFELFLIKLLISIFMILISFGYKSIKYTCKNFLYLYTSSMILGGFLYFLNIQFSYKQEGLIFYHNGLSINFIFLVIFSPIILYLYIKQGLELKNNYSKYYKVDILIGNKKYHFNGFLDTGNKLIDPISKKPVVVINEKLIKEKEDFIFVPYNTISGEGLLRCIPATISIQKTGRKENVLLGLMKKINMEGIDCIINPILVEE